MFQLVFPKCFRSFHPNMSSIKIPWISRMSQDVPRYQARPEIVRSFALRQDLHRLVEASPGFLEVYEQLLLWLGG